MNDTPGPTRLRRAARAIILADDDRVLLCRFSFPHPAAPAGATVVWAAPGGGIEPGERPLAALRRELHEETGLVIDVATCLMSGTRSSSPPAMRRGTTGCSMTTSSSAPRTSSPAA